MMRQRFGPCMADLRQAKLGVEVDASPGRTYPETVLLLQSGPQAAHRMARRSDAFEMGYRGRRRAGPLQSVNRAAQWPDGKAPKTPAVLGEDGTGHREKRSTSTMVAFVADGAASRKRQADSDELETAVRGTRVHACGQTPADEIDRDDYQSAEGRGQGETATVEDERVRVSLRRCRPRSIALRLTRRRAGRIVRPRLCARGSASRRRRGIDPARLGPRSRLAAMVNGLKDALSLGAPEAREVLVKASLAGNASRARQRTWPAPLSTFAEVKAAAEPASRWRTCSTSLAPGIFGGSCTCRPGAVETSRGMGRVDVRRAPLLHLANPRGDGADEGLRQIDPAPRHGAFH